MHAYQEVNVPRNVGGGKGSRYVAHFSLTSVQRSTRTRMLRVAVAMLNSPNSVII